MTEYVIKRDGRYATPQGRWTDRISLARHWSVYDEADAFAREILLGDERDRTLDVVPVRKKASVRPETGPAPTEAARVLAEIRKDRWVSIDIPDADCPALFRQHEDHWVTEFYKVQQQALRASAHLHKLASVLGVKLDMSGALDSTEILKAAREAVASLAEMRLRIAQLAKT